ncbi:T-cell surface glycoprotein CD3 delta chain isoform X2 [Molossus molossus]|uniref:T-cell surface glycoprotein CD3 delta chain n=1 Tax=Molossus molossus TaxID=27622 RepID=A0A7J8EPF3_MOLMO|nr:T-cell surface glycoprotein CD3 delta chain isoform X2 [Molossus molossus]KAF6437175.1 CD3d molecule [Molossus molossus]
MERGRFLAGLMLAALLAHGSPVQILVEEPEDKVILSCNVSVTRLWGTEGEPLLNNKNLDLGKRVLDPRGQYTCGFFNESITNSMQIYYRMCQNCVQLDPAALAGIVIIDVFATLLLALGVYCFAGHETGRPPRASDTQALLKNEQLYQPLRDRNDAQYSHLGANWARNK